MKLKANSEYLLETLKTRRPNNLWSVERWAQVERETRLTATKAATEKKAWQVIAKRARAVMHTYTTSFFLVSRFLPPIKRAKVEIIYSAVRYPDEIVDTFPLHTDEQLKLLNEWSAQYEEGLAARSIIAALNKGVPCFLAAFTSVVRDEAIPPEHYRSFIEAMRMDIRPRRFSTLDDLIESYIYGSAIVVGYFLTYVYGASFEQDFERALKSARDLGIALQLTNFLRDVGEDQRRGRLYLPMDMLRAEGIEEPDVTDPAQHPALNRVLRRMAAISEDYYARSYNNLDDFSPDCRIAIHACIDVYRKLNDRIGRSPQGILHRESVPLRDKFKVLPASKYWRLPLAYLMR